MRRKFGLPTLPNLYFRPADGILSVPGYTFEKVSRLPLHNDGLDKRGIYLGYAMGRHRQYDLSRGGEQS